MVSESVATIFCHCHAHTIPLYLLSNSCNISFIVHTVIGIGIEIEIEHTMDPGPRNQSFAIDDTAAEVVAQSFQIAAQLVQNHHMQESRMKKWEEIMVQVMEWVLHVVLEWQ